MSSARPVSATTRKGDDRRATILQTAATLFSEQGYRGTSLGSVAAAAGLTQPGLLHYFSSKEALLLALLDSRYHMDGRRLSGALDQDGLPLLEALRAIVAANQGSPTMVRLFTVLVAESIFTGHPAHEHFERRYHKVREHLELVLRGEQESGSLRSDVDLHLLVPVIVAVMDGLQTQWLLDPELDMTASFALFSHLVSAALSPPEDVTRPGRRRSAGGRPA